LCQIQSQSEFSEEELLSVVIMKVNNYMVFRLFLLRLHMVVYLSFCEHVSKLIWLMYCIYSAWDWNGDRLLKPLPYSNGALSSLGGGDSKKQSLIRLCSCYLPPHILLFSIVMNFQDFTNKWVSKGNTWKIFLTIYLC
jgi:hypothetical protein